MKALHEGDKIVVCRSGFGEPYYVAKITKVLPTQIEIENGKRFMLAYPHKQRGHSDSWYVDKLATDFVSHDWLSLERAQQANDEWNKKNGASIKRSRIKRIVWSVDIVSDAVVDEVYDYLQKKGLVE